MADFNPPTSMDFSMGSTEQKMAMSLGKHFPLLFPGSVGMKRGRFVRFSSQ
jgi:hypothetical protein